MTEEDNSAAQGASSEEADAVVETIYSDDIVRFNERLRHRENGRCRVGVLTNSLKSA